MRVLYAASELHPLVKIGGLGDVAASLPSALAREGADVRIVLPAYRGWRERVGTARTIVTLPLPGGPATVHEASHSGSGVPLWLVDRPDLFDRPGSPYEDAQQRPWPDNSQRFGTFARAVAALAEAAVAGFAPDVVHGNDWHTGLVMPWLRERARRPRTVFTIHNLAYQGVFPRADMTALGLPEAWWHLDGVEFHGQLSHLKAGIAGADVVTTVSPTYAREIQDAGHGHGLDGLLRARAAHLHGIVNGIDDEVWNPAADPHLAAPFSARALVGGKAANRRALQETFGLPVASRPLLVGVVSRFAAQKGVDLLPAADARLPDVPLQFALLGRGEPAVEAQLRDWAAARPGRVSLHIAHDEALAHRVIAGSDVLVMPSRYEPCGLTQMYAQRYGTVPVVRRTGGLVDTVVDATPQALADGSATGVHFSDADAGGVAYGLRRAHALRADTRVWRALQRAGMRRDFSWRGVAAAYLRLYDAGR